MPLRENDMDSIRVGIFKKREYIEEFNALKNILKKKRIKAECIFFRMPDNAGDIAKTISDALINDYADIFLIDCTRLFKDDCAEETFEKDNISIAGILKRRQAGKALVTYGKAKSNIAGARIIADDLTSVGQIVSMYDGIDCTYEGSLKKCLSELKDKEKDAVITDLYKINNVIKIRKAEYKGIKIYPYECDRFIPLPGKGVIMAAALSGSEAEKAAKISTDMNTLECFLIEREIVKRISDAAKENNYILNVHAVKQREKITIYVYIQKDKSMDYKDDIKYYRIIMKTDTKEIKQTIRNIIKNIEEKMFI